MSLITHFTANGPIQTAYHDLAANTDPAPATANRQAAAPFVLVHGFTGSKLDFSDQLPWFTEQHRVLAYDQRGHGESSNVGPYNLYTLTADLLNWLDALNIERCHVLGHSLGGMVVMRALLSHPARFSSAILMDTAPYPLKLYSSQVRERLKEIVTQHGCQGLLDGMRGQVQNAAVQRGIDFLGNVEHWRRIQVKLTQMDVDAFVTLSEVLDDHPPVLESLSKLQVPTTVVVGAEDKPFLTPSRAMAAAIPNAELQIIRDAGHSPQYENHAAWRDVVAGHLRTHSF